MRKIGILGGTFDPPHIGHLIIADQILHKCRLEEIWFMPNYLPPHKEKETSTTTKDRIEMLNLATQGHGAFKIETIELERKERSYTYDTMLLLQKREPDTEFYFIIGADMVEYLPNWYKINELVQIVRLIGVNRPRYELKTDFPIEYVYVPSIGLSSSLIRKYLAENRPINYLLPKAVIEYIKENGLYGKK